MQEAKNHLLRAVDINPRYESALLRLAYCHLQIGSYELAITRDIEAGRASLAAVLSTGQKVIDLDGGGPNGTEARHLMDLAQKYLNP
jgi:hypothetical protein